MFSHSLGRCFHIAWVGTLEMPVSQLNTQPMVPPVDASRQPARAAAHDSGPERLARPYSAGGFHGLSFASLSWRSLLLANKRYGRRFDSASDPEWASDIDTLIQTRCQLTSA